MDSVKVNKLDAKLREMFESNRLMEAKRMQRKHQAGAGSIIRRRKGKPCKRIAM